MINTSTGPAIVRERTDGDLPGAAALGRTGAN